MKKVLLVLGALVGFGGLFLKADTIDDQIAKLNTKFGGRQTSGSSIRGNVTNEIGYDTTTKMFYRMGAPAGRAAGAGAPIPPVATFANLDDVITYIEGKIAADHAADWAKLQGDATQKTAYENVRLNTNDLRLGPILTWYKEEFVDKKSEKAELDPYVQNWFDDAVKFYADAVGQTETLGTIKAYTEKLFDDKEFFAANTDQNSVNGRLIITKAIADPKVFFQYTELLKEKDALIQGVGKVYEKIPEGDKEAAAREMLEAAVEAFVVVALNQLKEQSKDEARFAFLKTWTQEKWEEFLENYQKQQDEEDYEEFASLILKKIDNPVGAIVDEMKKGQFSAAVIMFNLKV